MSTGNLGDLTNIRKYGENPVVVCRVITLNYQLTSVTNNWNKENDYFNSSETCSAHQTRIFGTGISKEMVG
jgi:hypothetical protein